MNGEISCTSINCTTDDVYVCVRVRGFIDV